MILNWYDIADQSIRAASETLLRKAKRVAEVTLADLAAPIPEYSTGVYFFWDAASCVYVGSARSRCLIERIPAHLDTRPGGWFNSMLKAMQPGQPLPLALAMALELKLSALCVRQDQVPPAKLEALFQHALRPRFNRLRRPRIVNAMESLQAWSVREGHVSI